jgi:hypothetical protein
VDLCRESDSRTAAVAAEHDLASHTIIVPPPNMSQQMLQLLESKVGADVTFHVEHREFQAHKILLAMRSPVFRARVLRLYDGGGHALRQDPRHESRRL